MTLPDRHPFFSDTFSEMIRNAKMDNENSCTRSWEIVNSYGI